MEESNSLRQKDRGLVRKAIDWYFEIRPCEKGRRVYETLGVRKFQKLYWMTYGKIMEFISEVTPEERMRWFLNRSSRERTLKRNELDTRIKEGFHQIFNVTLLSLSAYELSQNNCLSALCGFSSNLAVNIYPIMLQRYNRGRTERTLGKLNERASSEASGSGR